MPIVAAINQHIAPIIIIIAILTMLPIKNNGIAKAEHANKLRTHLYLLLFSNTKAEKKREIHIKK